MAGNNELTGKVAIVTGAGRNIGRAIALALAEDGASVVVNVRSNRAEAEAVAREIEAKGGKALVHLATSPMPRPCRRWRMRRQGNSGGSIFSSTTLRCGGRSHSPT
jgi:NAD(P)-dependent dehydrogenase (short-subunit alcohol dehydrogenase family)